jgi:hypothetical protein
MRLAQFDFHGQFTNLQEDQPVETGNPLYS